MEKRKKVVVIGSGFGGLSSAIRLAAKGHDVTIIEKRDKPGGRAYQYEIDGFKFDGGPTVITAPYIFDEIFEAAGKNREEYFKLAPLDPFYRIFDSNGKHFDYMRNEQDVLKEIDRWNPADKKGYLKFTKRTIDIFNLFHPYTDKPFLRFRNMLKIMPGVIRLGAYMGTHSYVKRYIKHDFLRKVFSFHPLLIGGNPFDTPSIYLLIMQFEKEWGVHYAVGGVGSIIQALARLFEELGGTILLNSEVDRIMIQGETVTGVKLKDGTAHKANVVVSNADAAFTYRKLIPEESRKKYSNRQIDRKSYSSSLFVIYFGTKKRYLDSKLSHHNIIVSKAYRKLMKEIFKGTKLPNDLSLYMHMPTRSDASIAPDGCELFYVLALVPNMKADIEWEKVAKEYKSKILDFLEENYLPDLQENIIAEHYIDPPHFQNTLNSHYGAAFSFTPSLMQSAYFRPHNRSEQFKNLYFVGAGTHPGAGVPAVLSSGKIAAELIDPSPIQNGR